jgi:hypothetical protein
MFAFAGKHAFSCKMPVQVWIGIRITPRRLMILVCPQTWLFQPGLPRSDSSAKRDAARDCHNDAERFSS